MNSRNGINPKNSTLFVKTPRVINKNPKPRVDFGKKVPTAIEEKKPEVSFVESELEPKPESPENQITLVKETDIKHEFGSEAQKKEKLKTKIKASVLDTLANTSLHGIPSLVRTERWILRIIWSIAVVGAMAYFIYCLYGAFTEYLNFSVITQITVERQAKITFPTVTFCNRNPFNQDANGVLAQTLNNYNSNWISQFTYLNDYSEFLEYISRMSLYLSNSTELSRKQSSFSLDEMLLVCHFNNKPCSKDDFEYFFSYTYGNCYKFNSGSNLKQLSMPGRNNGLRLELFLGEQLSNSFITSVGARLFVHNSTTTPLTDIEGVSLSTGFETDVVINQVYFNRQSDPYSNCILNLESSDSFNSDLYKKTVKLIKTYRQMYCLQLCYQQYIIENCGCYDISLPLFETENKIPCNNFNSLVCSNGFLSNFTSSSKNSTCFKNCPLECDSVQYNLVLSQSDYPSLFYADLIKKYQNFSSYRRNFADLNDIKSKVLAVNVYYDDISYTLVNEIAAKKLEQFIGDIGSYIGLCIGGSLLFFVEIIELILQILFTIIKHNNKSRVVQG